MNLLDAQREVILLCKQAGETIQQYFLSGSFSHHSKGGMDFATEVDDEIDRFLKVSLEKKFPTTHFLTEETSTGEYSSFIDKEYLWVIDPIDGTTNFSRGDDHFAIAIGLVNRSQTVLGIVYLPIEDKLYSASIEQAQALCNEKPIHVSDKDDLGTVSLGFDYSWNMSERKKTLKVLEKLATSIRQPRSLGSAAADMCLVAEGKLDGYINFGLKPWDHAAAGLIVEKAGGKVTKVDGSRWDVFKSDTFASNSVIHPKILSQL